jgi:hypothetical protein
METKRATPEDRLMAELAWQAVRDEVPRQDAVAYMDALRGSLWGQHLLLSFHMQEAFHQIAQSSKRGRFAVWLSVRIARLPRSWLPRRGQ